MTIRPTPANIERDDLPAEWRDRARQSRLANAAQLRRDGPAPQGAAGMGANCPAASWAARPITWPRLLSGQMMGIEVFDNHEPETRPGVARLLRLRAARATCFLDLCDHQSAGRSLQGVGRAGCAGHGRAHRRRGCVGHHHPRRQNARHRRPSWPTRCFVANPASRCGRARKHLAFSCALPMSTKGLKVLSRKVYEAHAPSVLRQSAGVALRRERRADVSSTT